MPKIAMAHNFVLLNKAAKVVDFATAAMNARATDFIPADKKADIVAHTGLAGAGETVEVTFKVPAAAGEYPYLLLPRPFPGRNEGIPRRSSRFNFKGFRGFKAFGVGTLTPEPPEPLNLSEPLNP